MTLTEYIYQHIGRIAELIEERRGRPYHQDSTKHNTEFVGRIPITVGEFEAALHKNGFDRVSYGPERSWARSIGDERLHIVFYGDESVETRVSGYTYVYAHVEIKPTVAPLRHLRNDSRNGPLGVKKVKKLLDENGIAHEPIRP